VTALFLNHCERRCGVYQMGARIGRELSSCGVAAYAEVSELDGAVAAVHATRASAIIYNWHPSTMPWASELVRRIGGDKHLGLIHEIAPDMAGAGADVFPYRIACDPSFPADGERMFRTVRHVPRSELRGEARGTIGSFGFAVGGKMFPTVVHAVAVEFPGATLRLRIPMARYGDDSGALARACAEECARTAIANGARVVVEHDFLPEGELIDWLSGNDLNVFFYEPNGGRGIASALDYAIAARRPIAINDSQMFRHVRERLGYYPQRNLRTLMENTGYVVESIYNEWSPERLVLEYADILRRVGAA
jgi:hypothetical protein